MENYDTFEGFRPISLFNFLYNIISKVLTIRLKPMFSKFILANQFGFLEGRQIHKKIGMAQEGLHKIKLSKISTVIINIDMFDAYDRVS